MDHNQPFLEDTLKLAKKIQAKVDDEGGLDSLGGIKYMSEFESNLDRYTYRSKKQLLHIEAWILVIQEADLETGKRGRFENQFRHEANLWIWRCTNNVACYFLRMDGSKRDVVTDGMVWRMSLIVEEWNYICLHDQLSALETNDDDDWTVDQWIADRLLHRQHKKQQFEKLFLYMDRYQNSKSEATWTEALLRSLRFHLFGITRSHRATVAAQGSVASNEDDNNDYGNVRGKSPRISKNDTKRREVMYGNRAIKTAPSAPTRSRRQRAESEDEDESG